MASLLEWLEARQQAARMRVEGLRAEMDRLAEQMAGEQELLGRLEITRQTVIELWPVMMCPARMWQAAVAFRRLAAC